MTRPPPSAFPPLPGASAWPLLRALLKRPSRAASHPVSASYRLERIDAGHVRRYSEAFGFPAGPVPLTYLYLLAQRAQLATMLDGAMPFRIPGLIHVANDLTMHGPMPTDAPLVLTTTLAMPAPGANGAVECVLATQGTHGARLVFACTSRYLIKRGQRGQRGPRDPQAQSASAIEPGRIPVGEWLVAHDAGRRYAALSGDWNPIHLWPWSARLMGMQQPVIHGMHTVAKACALHQQSTGLIPASVNCHFRRPVLLGSTVVLMRETDSGGFTAVSGQRIAVEGTISDLAPDQ